MTLLELVERERARARALEVASGVALGVAVVCGTVGAGVLLLGRARWLVLPRGVPLGIWGLLAAGVWAVAVITRRRLRARTGRTEIATAIEQERSLRAGALRGAIEVAHTGALGQWAAALLSETLAPHVTSLAPNLRASALRRARQAGGVAAVTVVLLAVVAPLHSDGLMAILRPVSAWRGTLLPRLGFVQLPDTVMRGDTIRVRIAAAGRATVNLQHRGIGEGWTTQTLAVSPISGVASATLGPLHGDISLVITDGRAYSDTATVRVTDRPFVGAISMRAVYPSYLDRTAETLPVGETAVVPRGTTIEITGRASTRLADVGLVQGRDTVALVASDRTFEGRLAPVQSGHWAWYARGLNAMVNDLPLPIDVTVLPDSAPHIDITAPQTDTLVASLDTVAVQGAASDDHGLAVIELHIWRAGLGGTRKEFTQKLAVNQGPAWGGSGVIDLASQSLQPGDALHVSLSATDNSPWAQRSTSRELLLKVPSVEERRQLARDAADSAVQAIQRTAAAEQGLQQRTSEAARAQENRQLENSSPSAAGTSGAKQNSLNYETAQKAKALAKEQQDLADRVTKLQQSADELRQQLAKAGAMDSSLSRQLQEAQQMLKDALTPQLLNAMKQLQQSAQQLNAAGAQQSLANLAEMQKRMREQLEKSAQMLQRAAFEGAMQTLHDEATDIAGADQKLADSTTQPAKSAADSSRAPASAPPPTVDTQRALADRSARLSDAIKQLEQKLADASASTGAKNANDAHTFSAASEQSMRKRADAQTAANEMKHAAQSMQQARDSQVAAWKDELTSELDRAVQELLQMSRQEQRMQQDARSGKAVAEDLRGNQSAVMQGVDQTQQRLMDQAQKTTLLSGRAQRAMADAQQKVAVATKSASDPRNVGQTPGAMGDAADALNRAAAALARDRQHANSSNSASGFAEMLQQLQEAAKKQGSINAQAQSLMPIPGQPQMSPEAQATARMLANQERALAQKLDDISDANGGDRAAQLSKEARAVAEQLEQARVDATTVARQEQLLQHMLDAGRSLQKDEQDDSGKREAQSAVNPQIFTPQTGNASGKNAAKFQPPTWDELRGLSADERRAVLEYFKRINGGSRL